MDQLPTDILYMIFDKIKILDFINLRRVCKRFNDEVIKEYPQVKDEIYARSYLFRNNKYNMALFLKIHEIYIVCRNGLDFHNVDVRENIQKLEEACGIIENFYRGSFFKGDFIVDWWCIKNFISIVPDGIIIKSNEDEYKDFSKNRYEDSNTVIKITYNNYNNIIILKILHTIKGHLKKCINIDVKNTTNKT